MGKIEIDLEAKINGLLSGTEEAVNSVSAVGKEAEETKAIIEQSFRAGAEATAKYVKEQITATGAAKQFNAETQKAVKQLYEEGKVMDALILRHGSAKKALAEVNKELQSMQVLGKRNTTEFRELAAVAGELTDAIGDTRDEVKKLASDTSSIDTFVQGVGAVASGMSVAQGAAALLGDESEDLQKALLKVQAAMAIATGTQQLANIATEKGGIATKAYGVALKVVEAISKTTGLSIAASWAVATAGLSVLIGGVISLIAYMRDADDAASEFELKRQESLKQQTEFEMEQKNELQKRLKDADEEFFKQQEVERRKRLAQGEEERQVEFDLLTKQIEKFQNKIKAYRLGLYGYLGLSPEEEAKRIAELEDLINASTIERNKLLQQADEERLKNAKKVKEAIKREFATGIDLDLEQQVGAAISDKAVSDAIMNAFRQFRIPQQEMIKQLSEKLGLTPKEIAEFLQTLDYTETAEAILGGISDKAEDIPLKIEPKVEFLGQIVTEDQKQKLEDAIRQIAENITKVLNTAFDTAIRTQQTFIDSLDERIEKQKEVVANEEALAKKGATNELQFEKEKLDKLNAEREKALQKQKALQSAQLAIDTVTQLSSLVTAAAKTYESLAAIPGGVAVASALIASMFAAFAASKVAAAVLVSQQKGYKKGGYTGDGSPDEEAGVVHKREFVMPADITAKNLELFEGIYGNDQSKIISGITSLLEGTGVTLNDDSMSNELRIVREENSRSETMQRNRELELRIEKLNEDMNAHLSKEKETIIYGDGEVIIKKGNNTRRIKRAK